MWTQKMRDLCRMAEITARLASLHSASNGFHFERSFDDAAQDAGPRSVLPLRTRIERFEHMRPKNDRHSSQIVHVCHLLLTRVIEG